MKLSKIAFLASGLIFSLVMSSCVTPYSAENPPLPNPLQKEIPKAIFVNPYPEGSYAHFKAKPEYPKTYKVWKNKTLYNSTPNTLTRVVIDLSKQRGILYKGNTPILDYPISSGKRAFPTKPGSYEILRKVKLDKRSNLYGKIYNAEGKVIKSDGDANRDAALIGVEGNKFVGAPMKYWMRLTWNGLGMHQGRVPRYPASHGCIRTYSVAVRDVFNKVRVGTPVLVVD